jgi:hypothetical protein
MQESKMGKLGEWEWGLVKKVYCLPITITIMSHEYIKLLFRHFQRATHLPIKWKRVLNNARLLSFSNNPRNLI